MHLNFVQNLRTESELISGRESVEDFSRDRYTNQSIDGRSYNNDLTAETPK